MGHSAAVFAKGEEDEMSRVAVSLHSYATHTHTQTAAVVGILAEHLNRH